MTEHKLFYYPCASFTNVQLQLLEVAAPCFDKLVILGPVGASWDTIGADHVARDASKQLNDAGSVVGTASAVLAVVTASITPVVLATAGLRLTAASMIPGAE